MADTLVIGYQETPDAEHNCSACGGVSVPNSTISEFHFHHKPNCELYRALSSTMLSDRERFDRYGRFDRPYRSHELTLIDDSGKRVAPVNAAGREVQPDSLENISRVFVHGTRGSLGFYDPSWQYVGLKLKSN